MAKLAIRGGVPVREKLFCRDISVAGIRIFMAALKFRPLNQSGQSILE
jgi:hypothetical protein